MTTIGFIGLGSMGQAMAARLLEEGFEVSVWNRTASAGDELVAAGATRLDSPAQAFERDIVVSILANDQAVDAVFSEELLAGAAAANGDALHVNMASISLETARLIEARHQAAGVRYIGAPVMGRPNVARAGQLNILAGGPAETVEAAAPVLDVLGKKTWHVAGDAAGASLVKIGVGLKDLTLAEKAAAELGAALPVAPALHELFDAAVGNEERREGDWSIIAEVLRER